MREKPSNNEQITNTAPAPIGRPDVVCRYRHIWTSAKEENQLPVHVDNDRYDFEAHLGQPDDKNNCNHSRNYFHH